MDSWHTYPSIYAMGHRLVNNLLTVPVIAEEKVDGSQFSFGVDEAGVLHCRSKGQILNVDAPEKMFENAVKTAQTLAPTAHRGWTYRCEYLRVPKHNTLSYGRTPDKHLILFDVNTGNESYLPYPQKLEEAYRIGLEVVPLLAEGTLTLGGFQELLQANSILGGTTIEGVVVKPANYDLWGPDKKVLMAKYVSEMFKEKHQVEWKKTSPKNGDILNQLCATYKAEGRWAKAVQHLGEDGSLDGSPKDIGALIKEVQADVHRECADEIKEALFKWAWPHIQRSCVAGVPEWYKQRLLEAQFERTN